MSSPKSDSTVAKLPWSNEPFRAFFPLGLVAAILGTAIWPLVYSGLWKTAPQLLHPRIMIFGFGAAFMAGFLGTAWPRFVEAPPMRARELVLLVATWAAAQACYLFHQIRVGDTVFAIHLLALIAFLIDRARRGPDPLPPGLRVAFLGPVSGLAAATWWAWQGLPLSPAAERLARLLTSQGMLLLPLLGIGTFFFPRFFAVNESADDGRPMPQAQHLGLGLVLFVLLLLASFAVEAGARVRTGSLLRFSAVIAWGLLACPAIVRGAAPSTRAWALRLALGTVAAAFLIRCIWPGPGYAIEHLLLIGGFGLAIPLVAERVTLGHAERPPCPTEKSTRWRWFAWLLLLAASTRMSADFKASLVVSHHIYAALIWIGVLVSWALPLVRHWPERPTP